MFASCVRNCYAVLRTDIRHYARRVRRLQQDTNAGISRRLDAFRADGVKFEQDVDNLIEESESDIYKIGTAYDRYQKDNVKHQIELRRKIVKQKYFSEELPNLLTWSEKEQIRDLHAQDPNEWTPEKIAEAFPVTAEIVKKLLKFVWKPTTDSRILRHDASAMRNWRELKEGTLEISPEFRDHLMKFSNRTIPPLKKQTDPTKDKKIGEFQAIIEKFAKKEKTKGEKVEEQKVLSNSIKDKPVNMSTFDTTKRMTLNELQNKLQSEADSGKQMEQLDEMIMTSSESTNIITPKDNVTNLSIEKIQQPKNQLIQSQSKEDDLIAKSYPEKIKIPRKAWKQGGTYRVEDCYYDDDGLFLYRVPGMTTAKTI